MEPKLFAISEIMGGICGNDEKPGKVKRSAASCAPGKRPRTEDLPFLLQTACIVGRIVYTDNRYNCPYNTVRRRKIWR